jgi:hypothetical protein
MRRVGATLVVLALVAIAVSWRAPGGAGMAEASRSTAETETSDATSDAGDAPERRPRNGARATGLRDSIAPALAPIDARDGERKPLPPRDARIIDVFDELDRRAERGDVAAACRLGFDLTLCRERQRHRDIIEFFLDSGAKYPDGTEGSVRIVQELEATLAHAAMICEGLPAPTEADAWRHLARAGNLGDDRAAARFGALPPLEIIDDGTETDARRYHADHGARLLLEAFERGNPEALFMIHRQYAGLGAGFARQLAVEPDPVRALGYAMVLAPISDPNNERWFNEQIEAARAEWQPAEFERAVEIANEYRGRHELPTRRIDFDGGVFRDYNDSTHCEKHVEPRD